MSTGDPHPPRHRPVGAAKPTRSLREQVDPRRGGHRPRTQTATRRSTGSSAVPTLSASCSSSTRTTWCSSSSSATSPATRPWRCQPVDGRPSRRWRTPPDASWPKKPALPQGGSTNSPAFTRQRASSTKPPTYTWPTISPRPTSRPTRRSSGAARSGCSARPSICRDGHSGSSRQRRHGTREGPPRHISPRTTSTSEQQGSVEIRASRDWRHV